IIIWACSLWWIPASVTPIESAAADCVAIRSSVVLLLSGGFRSGELCILRAYLISLLHLM
ncbi:MAG TPA: hypothetical protein VKT28_09310, partial [Puia sp.]|nr:hypothetical protein [Puia sp.]